MALNNLQRLICHKTQPTNQSTSFSGDFNAELGIESVYSKLWQIVDFELKTKISR